MFQSLLYDHPQGLSFILSALPLLCLYASSFCLFGMWLYVVCVCVCVCVCAPDVPVCEMSGGELSVHDQTSHRQVHLYCVSSAMDETDNDTLWNGSEEDGCVRCECEEEEDTDYEYSNSDTDS
jgi:hypothetical protein